jgi:hypothetical protein
LAIDSHGVDGATPAVHEQCAGATTSNVSASWPAAATLRLSGVKLYEHDADD